MGILIVADSAEDLPEGLRASAKQTENGKYQVTALPEGWGVENVKGLRNSLGSERSVRKLLSDKLSEFGWKLSEAGDKWTNEGLSPSDARGAVEAVASGKVKSSKEIEDYKAEIAKAAEAREKGLSAARDRYRQQLERELVEKAAIAAISKHGGAKSLRVLMPLVKDAAKVEESADGSLRVVLYGEDGKQRFSVKSGAAGAPMDLDEWVEELRGTQDFKPLFEAKQAGGSGSSSQSGGTGRVVDQGSAKLSARELIQRANEQSTPAGAAG